MGLIERGSGDWTPDELKAECRRLARLRDRAYEDAGRAEQESERLAAQLAGAVDALEKIDREARVIVLNDDDAQARHQRIADIAADYFHHRGGR